jgi:putative transposase
MHKTVACKLNPTQEQEKALLDTLDLFAEACKLALEVANTTGKRRAYDIHHECYYAIKETTGLTSNYVVRAIARVAQSFGKKNPPKEFHPTSLDLDKDLIRFIPLSERVSIATIAGRQKIKLQLGNYQRHLLKGQKPTTGYLAYDRKHKTFHVHFVIEVSEPTPKPEGAIGVDLGINRIATTSMQGPISGMKLNRKREKLSRVRASLQSKGTKGAKRTLKRLRRKESRYQSDVNHCISKKIVEEAKATNKAIVLEDLTGIRKRGNSKGKRMRRMLGRWAFYQLRQFIEYKAKQAGVKVTFISPAYTSKTCSACGLIGRRRKHLFQCSCGFTDDADVNAAHNIAAQGALVVGFADAVNRPEIAALSSDKPPALAGGD